MRQRQGSGPSGQLVDPRNGQRRVVHQAGKTWRTVDTEDIHEKTHQNEHGELITETARTAQQEQFQNVMVSDPNPVQGRRGEAPRWLVLFTKFIQGSYFIAC